MPTPDRRDFFHASAALLGAAFTIGRNGLSAQPAQPHKVRKDVATLAADGPELSAYRKAISTMKKWAMANMNDRRGWVAQAARHRTDCPHGNWFFLPWHRAYLYYFEEICRQASGDADFALPYWDWTKDPIIPASFWDGEFNADRAIGRNGRYVADFVGPAVILRIGNLRDFTSFGGLKAKTLKEMVPGGGGELESTPHNYVHRRTGRLMGDVNTAALDPIFWLHHANVDRLWADWDLNHPGLTPQDKDWLDLEMPFIDATGKAASKKVSDVLDNYGLGYRYDTQPAKLPVFAGAPLPVFNFAPPAGLALTQTTATDLLTAPSASLDFTQKMPFKEKVGAALTGPRWQADQGVVRLIVQDITLPNPPEVAIRVFVNLPRASADTPITDQHFAGTFTFFTHGGHDKGAAVLDLTPTLRVLSLGGQYSPDKPLSVQLVAAPLGEKMTGKLIPQNVRVEFASAGAP